MAISYYDYPDEKKYIENRFLTKKLGENRYLITTDHGAWAILSKKEYDLLRLGRLNEDPSLINFLEEKGIILTERNIKKVLSNTRDKFSRVFNGTSLHVITTTLRCNQKCIYCHALSRPMDAKEYDMDEETARAVVDFIFQSPSKTIGIEFQGGEPLANFDIIKYIIEYAKKKNRTEKRDMRFMIVSNLTMMTKEKLKFLLKNQVGLCTSLDGPKEVHDKNRKYFDGRGSYDDVVHWIKDIKKQNAYTLGALPTISKFSLPYWKEIIDEYRRLGFDRIRIRNLMNLGFASARWDEIGYTAEEFLDFWKKSLDYILSLNRKGVRFLEGMTIIIARQFLSKDSQSFTCWGSPCGAALMQTAYNQDGDVYTCDEGRSFDIFKLGNVKENTYKEIYTSDAVLNIVSLSSMKSFLCDNCVWQPFCTNCLTCNYGQQKTLVPKMPESFECKIKKGMIEYVFEKLTNSPDRKYLLDWTRTKRGI
ncbi:MAG: His-Xaa-Ser system radical SAM maturase HxsB [Candidatus Aenigmarchaeota archaeon]|nr:His-Xaa-Ser system radical SAM maturase HxsB [Candidatus Aenigmarchaeota archaeon]